MSTPLQGKVEGLGDSYLIGIRWVAEGDDLLMFFEHADHTPVQLRAKWATDVRIDLDFGDQASGKALVWEASVEELEAPRQCKLLVDFGGAPDGVISLTCNELLVEHGGEDDWERFLRD